jgi:hypothetical protein
MADLKGSIDRVATTTGFSGEVRVDRDRRTDVAKAYGLAETSAAVVLTPPPPLPRTGRCRTLVRRPSPSRYPRAVRRVVGPDRADGPGGGHGAATQRRAGGVDALRAGLLAAPHRRGGEPDRLRRRVSFRTTHDSGTTSTVLSKTTVGAWAVARHLRELLTP